MTATQPFGTEFPAGGLRRDAQLSEDTTAFWEYGQRNGLPVVLVHGFRGDHHGLELIAQKIVGARIIVPDLPGFGYSPSLTNTEHTLSALGQWLVRFIAEVVPDSPYILVGHSFGTLVVSAALNEGANPAEVVLINPISSPALSGPRAFLSQLALLYYNLARAIPQRAGSALLRNRLIVRLMSETMAKTRDMPLREWIHDQHEQYFSSFDNRDSLHQMFRASISSTVRDFVSAFSMPTFIIAADRDDITPLAEQLKLARIIRGATLTVVPSAGHLIHYEAPDVPAALIQERVQALSGQHGDLADSSA